MTTGLAASPRALALIPCLCPRRTGSPDTVPALAPLRRRRISHGEQATVLGRRSPASIAMDDAFAARIAQALADAPPQATGVAVVRLGAIRRNYRKLRELAAPAETAAVVKANAYGLGAAEVFPALESGGLPDRIRGDAWRSAGAAGAVEGHDLCARRPVAGNRAAVRGAGCARRC